MSGETISVGPGKIALLEAIGKTRSITAAAKSIKMSYRRAWMLVDELNAALKKPAVHSAKGGDHGGGSELTAVGEALKFFAWSYKDGGAMAAELDYVPLPAPLIAQVKASWASEITSGGKAIWTAK